MTEVKLPSNSKELRIKHFPSMSMLPENMEIGMSSKLIFLADFLGLRYNQILDFTLVDVDRMYSISCKRIAELTIMQEPPKMIELKGQKFYRVDPDKIGIGWHIDFGSCDIIKDPVRLACLFYTPEGYNYSDVDENGNIKFPIASRYELFEQEFPLDVFLSSARFFLRRLLRSTRKKLIQKIARQKAKNKTSLLLQSLLNLPGKHPLKQ